MKNKFQYFFHHCLNSFTIAIIHLNSRTNNRGASLLATVAVISTGVVMMSLATLTLIENSSVNSAEFIKKKRSVFAAEGGIRIVQKLAQEYLHTEPNPTPAGLANYVRQKMVGIEMSGYTFSDIQSTMLDTGETVVPSGPFAGMYAQVNTVEFKLRASNANNTVSSVVTQKSLLGMIRLFQFFLFSDQYTEWNPGPEQNVQGRVHVNSDLCFGGTGGVLRLDGITASGRTMLISNRNCRSQYNNPLAEIFDGSNYLRMKVNADSGCTNCGGSRLDWKEYALSRWKGRVLDVAHQVQPLKLPGMGATTPAQRGRDNLGAEVSNNGSMRLLVDPVLPNDQREVRDAKFAAMADIRIVNGVWYLRDPANANAWPGVPIWSDHPGSFTTTDEEGIEGRQAVGQSDLRVARGWGAVTPRYFSRYEYDPANTQLSADPNGTISYGNLFRDNTGARPLWRPGHWTLNGLAAFCPGPETCTNCINGIMESSVGMTCSGGTLLHPSVGILNATRGGFLNGHAQDAPTGSAGLAHQFPQNFDVAQFQLALTQNGAGELGSYFGPGRFMGQPFNGIIYITNTWQGSLRGMNGTNTAVDWPIQGQRTDPAQPIANYSAPPLVQRALPYQLCSSSLAGQNFAGANGRFQIPDCANYSYELGPPVNSARPNVLRIHNGWELRPGVFPKGLSIATNLPAYVLGEFNTTSDTSSAMAQPWLPALVAADFVSHLSNNWNDQNSRWNANYVQRNAVTTRYNHSILAGYSVRSPQGGDASAVGVNTFARYNENWRGQEHLFAGSMVIGFSSVYFHFANECCSVRTYEAPERNWSYDEHLYNFDRQPPGTPSFYVYAVEDWKSGAK